MQPAMGTAAVMPASPDAEVGSAESRPRIEYAVGIPIPAGQEVVIYYTVSVIGVKETPAPATVTIIGAGKQ